MTTGDIHGPKPFKSIRFGDIHGPKPYKFIRLGDIHGPKPYKFIGFRLWAVFLVIPRADPDQCTAQGWGYAGVLPGRKSAFRARFWPECCWESIAIGPPAAFGRPENRF